MEELKARYIRTFLIFIVLMGGAVGFLRSQLNSMTEAQKTQAAQVEKQKAMDEIRKDEQEEKPETSSVEYTLAAQEAISKIGINQEEAVNELEACKSEGEPLQRAKAAIALANLYDQKGNIPSAISAYKTALETIENRNEKKDITRKIAELYLYQGEEKEALVYYEEIYSMTKETADFHNLAEMLAKLNNTEKLKYYYEKHVSWFPESKEELNKYDAWLKMKNGNLTN